MNKIPKAVFFLAVHRLVVDTVDGVGLPVIGDSSSSLVIFSLLQMVLGFIFLNIKWFYEKVMEPYLVPVPAPAKLVDDGEEGEQDGATDRRQHSANGICLDERRHKRH